MSPRTRSPVIRLPAAALLGAALLVSPNLDARPRPGTAQPGTQAPPVVVDNGVVPEHNKAIYFGYKGRVDTDLQFSKFAGGDYTVMGWFMPQYPYGNVGPIFAENGTGTWWVGQEDYRTGTGGFMDLGTPVLTIEIGNKKARYLAPAWQAGKWVHVAVVRKGDVVSLFLDGNKQTPKNVLDKQSNGVADAPEINLANATGLPGWQTKLRFGRRSGGPAPSQAIGQSYGVLDDVAVFDQALGTLSIKSIMQKKRLTGAENHLVAGWSFEAPAAGTQLPAKLQSSWTKAPRAYTVPVSNDRANSDASTFNNILIIGESAVAARLPFAKNEVWKVVQGMNDGASSHNGYAAFAYDFVLAVSQGGAYPNGTQYAPVKAAAAGKLLWYRKTGDYPEDEQEEFKLGVRVGVDEHFSYQHFAKNSLTPKATGGTYDAEDDLWRFELANAPNIVAGEELGKLGPVAAHLHFSGAGKKGYANTFPVAFTDYEASDDDGATWYHVVRGHPKKGQWIKRTDG